MDHHLQVFITVVEQENFSRAAEELHMTQPAVSQYIRALEENIGTRLLERTNKYVRLNKAGEIVYHHGKEISGLYTKMQTLVDDLMNKANGPLSIGASYTFGEYILPRMIGKLREDYPHIQPSITIGNTEKIAQLVDSHQLDIGIVEGHFNDKDLIIEEFAKDSMVLVGSPDNKITTMEQINSDVLNAETWIIREQGSGTREATDKVLNSLGLSPDKLMDFSSTQLIKESVEAGLGISLMSEWTIQRELKSGYIKLIDVDGLPLSREFSIITKSRFQTKALEVFIALLRRHKTITV